MDKILVVGVETVAGANIAATLAEYGSVVGIAFETPLDIQGCDIHLATLADSPADIIAEHAPRHIVYCGAAARSSWEADFESLFDASTPKVASQWAAAANEAQVSLTYLSSDALFTGPWMFHEERGPGECKSPQAQWIRQAEQEVLAANETALVVRTNVFGWSPFGSQGGEIEALLAEIEAKRIVDLDCIRHATPILASDLAEILWRCWQEQLQGIYHIAGAERVNPMKFAQRLADHFALPWLSLRREEPLVAPVAEFAAGECSLQTKKLRKAVCIAMPMLSESLTRLKEQRQNGYCDRFQTSTQPSHERVA
ncbi:MAG: sugar nucleotide-binding protein [Planctomycetaceae bacterium]